MSSTMRQKIGLISLAKNLMDLADQGGALAGAMHTGARDPNI